MDGAGPISSRQRLKSGVLLAALNLLCLLGAMHGRHVAFFRQVHYSHISSHGPRRLSSRGNRFVAEMVIPKDAVLDHAGPRSGHLKQNARPGLSSLASLQAAVVLPPRLRLPVPDGLKGWVTQENILTPVSMLHVPSLGRAPPVA